MSRQYFRKYYQENREKILIKAATWAKDNRTIVREYKRKHKAGKIIKARKFVDRVKLKYGCQQCGIKDLPCLDCHHTRDKAKLISVMIKHGYTIKSIKQELRKCQILCSNCHRRQHHTNIGYVSNSKGLYVFKLKLHSQCQYCQESYPACLDFHHLTDKILGIGAMIRNSKYTLADLTIELTKCIIVCSNCHRKLHTDAD